MSHQSYFNTLILDWDQFRVFVGNGWRNIITLHTLIPHTPFSTRSESCEWTRLPWKRRPVQSGCWAIFRRKGRKKDDALPVFLHSLSLYPGLAWAEPSVSGILEGEQKDWTDYWHHKRKNMTLTFKIPYLLEPYRIPLNLTFFKLWIQRKTPKLD